MTTSDELESNSNNKTKNRNICPTSYTTQFQVSSSSNRNLISSTHPGKRYSVSSSGMPSNPNPQLIITASRISTSTSVRKSIGPRSKSDDQKLTSRKSEPPATIFSNKWRNRKNTTAPNQRKASCPQLLINHNSTLTNELSTSTNRSETRTPNPNPSRNKNNNLVGKESLSLASSTFEPINKPCTNSIKTTRLNLTTKAEKTSGPSVKPEVERTYKQPVVLRKPKNSQQEELNNPKLSSSSIKITIDSTASDSDHDSSEPMRQRTMKRLMEYFIRSAANSCGANEYQQVLIDELGPFQCIDFGIADYLTETGNTNGDEEVTCFYNLLIITVVFLKDIAHLTFFCILK